MRLTTESPDQATGTSSWTGIAERVPRLSVIVVSGSLAIQGTSSNEPGRLWEAPYTPEVESTVSSTSGQGDRVARVVHEQTVEVTRRAVLELRRVAGLTWEQMAELLDVSRRSVHFWASGKPLNAANEARLLRILDVVRYADRGSAEATRSALLEPADGVTPFDLLSSERYEDAREQLGSGPGRPSRARTPLSAEARAARAPITPAQLVDAQHEPVKRHRRGRAANTPQRPTREGD